MFEVELALWCCLLLALYKAILTLSLRMKSYIVTIQMKATEQYFPLVLFICCTNGYNVWVCR